jgi:hypothetical protein
MTIANLETLRELRAARLAKASDGHPFYGNQYTAGKAVAAALTTFTDKLKAMANSGLAGDIKTVAAFADEVTAGHFDKARTAFLSMTPGLQNIIWALFWNKESLPAFGAVVGDDLVKSRLGKGAVSATGPSASLNDGGRLVPEQNTRADRIHNMRRRMLRKPVLLRKSVSELGKDAEFESHHPRGKGGEFVTPGALSAEEAGERFTAAGVHGTPQLVKGIWILTRMEKPPTYQRLAWKLHPAYYGIDGKGRVVESPYWYSRKAMLDSIRSGKNLQEVKGS